MSVCVYNNTLQGHRCLCVYIYICICLYVHRHIYRGRERRRDVYISQSLSLSLYIYILWPDLSIICGALWYSLLLSPTILYIYTLCVYVYGATANRLRQRLPQPMAKLMTFLVCIYTLSLYCVYMLSLKDSLIPRGLANSIAKPLRKPKKTKKTKEA